MSHSTSPGPQRGALISRLGRRIIGRHRGHRAAWPERMVFAVALMGGVSGMGLAFAAGLVAARWLHEGDPTWAVLATALGILAFLPLMRR